MICTSHAKLVKSIHFLPRRYSNNGKKKKGGGPVSTPIWDAHIQVTLGQFEGEREGKYRSLLRWRGGRMPWGGAQYYSSSPLSPVHSPLPRSPTRISSSFPREIRTRSEKREKMKSRRVQDFPFALPPSIKSLLPWASQEVRSRRRRSDETAEARIK